MLSNFVQWQLVYFLLGEDIISAVKAKINVANKQSKEGRCTILPKIFGTCFHMNT